MHTFISVECVLFQEIIAVTNSPCYPNYANKSKKNSQGLRSISPVLISKHVYISTACPRALGHCKTSFSDVVPTAFSKEARLRIQVSGVAILIPEVAELSYDEAAANDVKITYPAVGVLFMLCQTKLKYMQTAYILRQTTQSSILYKVHHARGHNDAVTANSTWPVIHVGHVNLVDW